MRCCHTGWHGFRGDGPPRGLVSVAVLVCLLVMTLIFGSLLRLVQSQRALVSNQERRLQADWLVESGLDRAAARLGEDAAYRGETWTLPADELGGKTPGVVTIVVALRREAADQRLVTVQADYPRDPRRRARSRRQVIVNVDPKRVGVTP